MTRAVVGVVGQPLTPEAARALTDEFKVQAAELWSKALALYEGDAHRALGYSSWGAYVEAEFGASDTTAYRWLQSARVVDQLPVGSRPASESVARELAPALKDGTVGEKWTVAVERFGPSPTAGQIRGVVRDGEPARRFSHEDVEGDGYGSACDVPDPREEATHADDPIASLIDRLGSLGNTAADDTGEIGEAWDVADEAKRYDLDEGVDLVVQQLRALQKSLMRRAGSWA